MMFTWEEGQRCNVCVQGLEIEHKMCDGHRKHCCSLSALLPEFCCSSLYTLLQIFVQKLLLLG